MKVQVLKLKNVNIKMSGSQSFRGSFMLPVTTLCIDMLQKGRPRYCNLNWICYGKEKVLFIIIKVWNMKNVSVLYQQKPIPQQSIFCLIRDINNYVEINIYWSYIHFVVRIDIFINLASNILLFASKKCFLTRQGLVGAGMNCWALVLSFTYQAALEYILK